MPITETKTLFWNEIHDAAFDLYFDKNTPQQDKFTVFEEVLYPAFKIIATSFQTNANWNDIGFAWGELTQEIITFTVQAIEKCPFDPNRGAKRCSYVQLIMQRRIWQNGNKHKKHRERFVDDVTQSHDNEENAFLTSDIQQYKDWEHTIDDEIDYDTLVKQFDELYNYIKPTIAIPIQLVILENIKLLINGTLDFKYKSEKVRTYSWWKSILQNTNISEKWGKKLIRKWVRQYNIHKELPIVVKQVTLIDTSKPLPDKCWYNKCGNMVRKCSGCGKNVVYKNNEKGWELLQLVVKENKLCCTCTTVKITIDESQMWQNEDGQWCRRCPDCDDIIKYKLNEENSKFNCRRSVLNNTPCNLCARK